MADLSGDAVPEILIADGADLENDIHSGATRQGSLQVLNARTGEPLWDKRDVAKIRCRDRQVQHLLTGPDADGDFIDDVYVVSTMVARDFGLTGTSIYVDILSAASGKRIRTTPRARGQCLITGCQDSNWSGRSFLGLAPMGILGLLWQRDARFPLDQHDTVRYFFQRALARLPMLGTGLSIPCKRMGMVTASKICF